MNFGTLGAGTVAQAIAGHLVAGGHKVTLSNSRGPDTLLDVVTRLGPLASAGTAAEAATADMVFLAVMWPQVGDALAGLPAWDGRILVDTTNTFDDLEVGTAGEFVAERAPGARVVKAFNTLYAPYIAADPRHAEGRQLLFYAGDDEAAKADFHTVAEGIGFAPVDAGSLREGGRLMQIGGPLSALHALKQD
ncbi:NAD(P)-binding domain-containing protein [Amycolatopsis sp., V23-08]|uniref:NAD(P)-binding domain-containing protein n=1 Tax=Amycolatopsis heterodermiae TaxID=3110235 RepID=A0ABU5R3V9_9PSEU|nr:NAD(P)-binding domain-containing protein [Amycolatopsis sp., V23-08]MEA5360901.1 NAD(P)-binding domain-containing protein [Amycolatopsis sp., V23-08]